MISTSRFHSLRVTGVSVLGLVAASWSAPAPAQINLSDIVAGGDGTGLGWTTADAVENGGDKYAAVNLDNGTFMTRLEADAFHMATTEADDPGENLNPSPVDGALFIDPNDPGIVEDASLMIDSVFFLPTLNVPLNLEHAAQAPPITFPYLAGDEWGNSWNHVLSNRTHDIDKGQEDVFAGGTADWETGIGIHASAGITFNLGEIRAIHGPENVVAFSTFIGADRCGALINFYVIFSDDEGIIDDPNGNASFTDPDTGEEIRYWVEASSPSSAAQYIAAIPNRDEDPEQPAKYLTLTVGAGGNGIGCDHGVLANPQILEFVPSTPVEDLSCVRNEAGGFDLSWTNPEELGGPVKILVDGEQVDELANDATSYTLDAADAGVGDFQICIDNGSSFNTCCRPSLVEETGRIKSNSFLILGPFQHPFDCDFVTVDELEQTHLPPGCIDCEFPLVGDTLEIDSTLSPGITYLGPGSVAGEGEWVAYDDGSEDGDQDLNAWAGNNGFALDQVMAWMVTYVEYLGPDPIDINICLGSDDSGQVYWDDQLVWTNAVCRGRGDCDDTVGPITVEPGLHALKVAAWDRAGGWGLRATLQDEFFAPITDGGDWRFHGRNPPEDELNDLKNGLSCECPASPVVNLACVAGDDGSIDVSWENPDDAEPAEDIVVLVDGEEAARVSGDSTSATVDAGDRDVTEISVVNGGGEGRAVSCTVFTGDELYINCGGGRLDPDLFTDIGDDRIWLEDSIPNPSPWLTSPNANTADFDFETDTQLVEPEFTDLLGALFSTERWNNGPIEYTIPVPFGEWEVTLLFAEGCCSDGCEDLDDPIFQIGACRFFDIFVGNGDLDIFVDPPVEAGFTQHVVAQRALGNLLPNANWGVAITAGPYIVEGETIKIHIADLGDGNPPENASIKGIAITRLGDIGPGDPIFRRGDTDANGRLEVTDPINSLSFQFLGTFTPPCKDAADFDDNGRVEITDPIANLSHQFLGQDPPPAPGKENCGVDPTPDDGNGNGTPGEPDDDLGCGTYPAVDAPPDAACN